MPNDNISSGEPRPVAPGRDSDYSLTIDDALALYEEAGWPRTRRSIQRYCAKGDLDCHRAETAFGEKFLITLASVERHISYINEVRPAAAGRDIARHDATAVAGKDQPEMLRQDAATSTDLSRPVTTDSRIVELLERENDFLREQVGVKDRQIAELQERAHETNSLINGLQRLLAPLLAAPDRVRDQSTPDRAAAGQDVSRE